MPNKTTFPDSTAQDTLLKTHSALIHAADEQEIIAALSLCTDDQAYLRLAYLDLDNLGNPTTMTVTANWHRGSSWPTDPLLLRALRTATCPLITMLTAEPDPVWFVEDLTGREDLAGSSLLSGAGRLVAIKLFGVDQVEQPSRWHGIGLITWLAPRPFTREERYLLITVCETAAAIVSHRRLYLQAQGNVRQLRRLDELKTDFLRTVSHELRSPLVGILTGAEGILHGSSDEFSMETRQDLEDIVQSGRHLQGVITDILDMVQIEAGMLKLYKEPANLAEVVQEAVQITRTVAEGKGLPIILDLDAELPPIRIDKQRIRQVMLNLLSNAVKFSEQGTIGVTLHREETQLVFSVRDEGVGIPPEDQAIVFNQFRRLDSQVARCAGGTGLGLPISKRLVELHQGQIWLTSQPNQGSTFSFSLPLGDNSDAHSIH